MTPEARRLWLIDRKTYLGGSDIGAILGINEYRTPLDVYLDKISDTIDENPPSAAAEWGTILEAPIADYYAKTTNIDIEEAEANPIRHLKYPHLAANIDRWVDNRSYILECKTAGWLQGRKKTADGSRLIWGTQGTDEIPESYKAQVMYYAAICNVPKVDIAVLIGGQDFRIYTYHHDQKRGEALIKFADNFWNNHILPRIPPQQDTLLAA